MTARSVRWFVAAGLAAATATAYADLWVYRDETGKYDRVASIEDGAHGFPLP